MKKNPSKSRKKDVIPIPDVLPVLPLMSAAIYPTGAITLIVGIRSNLKLLDDYGEENSIIALVPTLTRESEREHPKDMAEVGVACRIIDMVRSPGGSIQVTFQGIRRVAIEEVLKQSPYPVAKVSEPALEGRNRTREATLVKRIVALVEELVRNDLRYGPEFVNIAKMNTRDPGRFADIVAAYIQIDLGVKKELMSTVKSERRLEMLKQFIQDELVRISLIEDIENKALDHFEEMRRRKLLMERLRAIKRELGEEEPQEAMANRIREQMETITLPDEVRAILDWELERLKLLPITSHDFRSVCNYIEWLLGIPWKRGPVESINLGKVEKILKKEYHGLQNVKSRILESLSPLALDPTLTPPVLCIVGPPATGKTSIGRSLAEALNRKFAHFSVAGCKDDSDIKGIRRGLIGESPGMIIRALRDSGTQNFLMVIEDIDELCEEPAKGNPRDALVELFDPTRNCSFMDRYFNVPMDMSKIFFVTTAKVLWDIPDQIQDYVKIVNLSGYTEREKQQIARRFIIPRELQRAGLDRKSRRLESSASKKM